MALTSESFTNKQIAEQVQGLSLMIARSLPSLQAELKANKLLRALLPAHDLRVEAHNRIAASADTDSIKTAKINELLADPQDVMLPSCRILEADLPQELPMQPDRRNIEGRAQIRALLGALYVSPLPEED